MKQILVAAVLGLASGVGAGAVDGVEAQGVVSQQQKQDMIAHAYRALDSYFGTKSTHNLADTGFEYEKLFVTIYSDGKIRGCQSGSAGKGVPHRIAKDLDEAVPECIEDTRFGGVLRTNEAAGVEFVLNFLFNKRKVGDGTLATLQNSIKLGIHAIEVRQGFRKAYYKESVPITKNYSLKKTLSRLCKKARLRKNAYLGRGGADVYIYDTLTFRGTRDSSITDLYRYNATVGQETVDRASVKESVKLAAKWFAGSSKEKSGRLEYTYYPSKNTYSEKNNHVRQLATAWSLTKVRDFLDDHSLDSVVAATLDHYLKSAATTNDYAYVELDGKAKLAHNAFLILTLNNLEKYPGRDAWLGELAAGILSLQNEDGSLRTYFHSDRSTGTDYYPGEALLALMELYNSTQEKKYLAAVEKAVPFYQTYWRAKKNTAFVPWHTQAYLLLYRTKPDKGLADFVFEMNDWLIDGHQITEDPCPDRIGGFPKHKPRYSSSSYLEGICDAYALAVLAKDEERKAKYAQSMRSGIRFILQTQFTKENSFYLKRPDRAVGGFKESLVENDLRIDFTQHAVLALMKAHQSGVFQ